MIISISEVFDMVVMSLAVGYIFMDFFKPKNYSPDNLIGYYSRKKRYGKLDGFLFSIAVTAPAIIFHELGHKFSALAFGISSTFHTAYYFLGFGVLLKLIGSPFIFFVPAYVSIPNTTTEFQSMIIAFAGPFVNFLLWLIAKIVLRYKLKPLTRQLLWLTARINIFLFIFNMLPIPGFDGFKFYLGLIRTFI